MNVYQSDSGKCVVLLQTVIATQLSLTIDSKWWNDILLNVAIAGSVV